LDLGPKTWTLWKGHRVMKLLGPRSWNPPRALKPNWGPGSRKCHRVPRTKRLLDPRSQNPHQVLTSSTPPGPSPRRCPQILGASHPRLPIQWRSILWTPQGGSGPYNDWSTTSVRSSMIPRQDISRYMIYSTQSSLHQGSCAITFKLTRF
jgi:hypothetical protein